MAGVTCIVRATVRMHGAVEYSPQVGRRGRGVARVIRSARNGEVNCVGGEPPGWGLVVVGAMELPGVPQLKQDPARGASPQGSSEWRGTGVTNRRWAPRNGPCWRGMCVVARESRAARDGVGCRTKSRVPRRAGVSEISSSLV